MKLFGRKAGEKRTIDMGIVWISNYPILLPNINDKRHCGIILTLKHRHHEGGREWSSLVIDQDLVRRILLGVGYNTLVHIRGTKGVPKGTVHYLNGGENMDIITHLDYLDRVNTKDNRYLYVRDIQTGKFTLTTM